MHAPTHSSQMATFWPMMSARTSSTLFPQNEHLGDISFGGLCDPNQSCIGILYHGMPVEGRPRTEWKSPTGVSPIGIGEGLCDDLELVDDVPGPTGPQCSEP